MPNQNLSLGESLAEQIDLEVSLLDTSIPNIDIVCTKSMADLLIGLGITRMEQLIWMDANYVSWLLGFKKDQKSVLDRTIKQARRLHGTPKFFGD